MMYTSMELHGTAAKRHSLGCLFVDSFQDSSSTILVYFLAVGGFSTVVTPKDTHNRTLL